MDTIAVIDFETTGLSPKCGDRATEIAVVLVREGQIVDRYQSLMNAGLRIPPFITQLTGISTAMVRQAPPAQQVMAEVADFVGEIPLVAHNAAFDAKFWVCLRRPSVLFTHAISQGVSIMRLKNVLFLQCVLLSSAPVFAATWEALPEVPPIPADNPQNDAKVLLGKTLFFDPRFSEHGTLSCNSCHNVMSGGDDNRPNSIGMHDARGGRSSPTVWNAAFYSVQFWDGRAATLEDQAKGPVVNPIEMGMGDLETAMARLKKITGYQPMFAAAFPEAQDPVSADNAAKAVAAFERTLITPNSPMTAM